MAGFFILGTLAAFGALSLLWTLFGWLLPRGRGCAMVCLGMPDEEILTGFKWLRGLGLLDCPLLVVAQSGTATCPDVEICSGEALLSRLERERNRGNGTGNGDHSGCGQRRDLSEL